MSTQVDDTLDDGSAVDPQALAKIFGDDTSMHLNILQKFVIQTEEIVAAFTTAFQQRDAEQVAFQAHKMKSSARTVGANQLADLCFALETAGRDENWTEIDNLATGVKPAADRVKRYVDGL